MEPIQYEMKAPVGTLYLVADDNHLQGVFLKKQSIPTIKTLNLSNPAEKILAATIQQLEEYFLGQRKHFDLALHYGGTAFQNRVWRQLSKIPFGKTVSYRDIAQKIKNPKAVRAVGSANGKNPFCIIVPCHRVIAADGSLGGYAGGLTMKKQLLNLEQN